jgi:hypothetical protein
MSTLSHTFHPATAKRLSLVHTDAFPTEASAERFHPADDGLGCMRGLAVAMLCNVVFVLIIAAGWELWRLLR